MGIGQGIESDTESAKGACKTMFVLKLHGFVKHSLCFKFGEKVEGTSLLIDMIDI